MTALECTYVLYQGKSIVTNLNSVTDLLNKFIDLSGNKQMINCLEKFDFQTKMYVYESIFKNIKKKDMSESINYAVQSIKQISEKINKTLIDIYDKINYNTSLNSFTFYFRAYSFTSDIKYLELLNITLQERITTLKNAADIEKIIANANTNNLDVSVSNDTIHADFYVENNNCKYKRCKGINCKGCK